MVRLEFKHTLAARWFHWVNFPLLAMMIWSGLLIYWANDIYGIKWGNHEFFHLFPQSFYEVLGVPHRLAEGISLHFFFAWLFGINGVVYVIYLLASRAWRSLLPSVGSFARASLVALYDFHLVRRLPPQGKYNDAQRIAYTAVILMGAGSLITGLAIAKPLQVAWLTTACGGYEWARLEHFSLAVGFVLFFAIHLVQVAKAGWGNFQAMITGREKVRESVEAKSASDGETHEKLA